MVVYKIFDSLPSEVSSADPETVIPKLSIDVTDGFYHLSPESLLRGTLQRFFSTCQEVYLIHIDISDDRTVVPAPGKLGNVEGESTLKWDKVELKDTNEVVYFPHIYGDIKRKDILNITKAVNENGEWRLFVKV